MEKGGETSAPEFNCGGGGEARGIGKNIQNRGSPAAAALYNGYIYIQKKRTTVFISHEDKTLSGSVRVLICHFPNALYLE